LVTTFLIGILEYIP